MWIEKQKKSENRGKINDQKNKFQKDRGERREKQKKEINTCVSGGVLIEF